MKTQPLDQVSPGTRVAEDIRDASGAMLLPKGAELDERLVGLLRRKKISEVAVVLERSPEEQAALAAEVRDRLEKRFRKVAGHPLMERLKRMIFDYRCGERP